MKESIYIAGPMRGYENYNFSSFDAAKELLSPKYLVVSPTDLDREMGFYGICTEEESMKPPKDFDFVGVFQDDIMAVIDCGCIYMLSGWETSVGARAEHAVATAVGNKIFYETSKEIM